MKLTTRIYFLQIKLKQLKLSESYLFNRFDLIDFKGQLNLVHQTALLENNRYLPIIEQMQRETNRLENAYNCNEEDKRNIKLLFKQMM